MIDNYEDIKLDTDVIVDTNKRLVTVNTQMTDSQLYTWMKELWMDSSHYIKFLFPMSTFKDVFGGIHISIINGWEINGTHNLTEANKK